MRGFLSASCAVAVLGVGTGTAAAQDFKVRVSGDAAFQAVFASQYHNKNTRSVDFRNRFRLVVNPEAVGLNGNLTYGAVARLISESKDGTEGYDRAYVYVRGTFGVVTAGSINSFNDQYPSSAPVAWRPAENAMLAGLMFTNSSGDGYGKSIGGLQAWRWSNNITTGANTKIRYDSPIIKGFQFAAGYTPAAPGIEKGLNSGWTFNRNKSGVTDEYEIGLRFDSADKTISDAFGDFALLAGVNYHGGKVRESATVAQNDLSALQAGLQVGYGGFKIGGGYFTYGKSGLYKTDGGQVNAYTWRVAAQYTTGPWVAGIGYDSSQKDVDFDGGATHANDRGDKKTADQFSAGLTYNGIKGMSLSAEYGYITTKNTYSNLKDNTHLIVLTNTLKF